MKTSKIQNAFETILARKNLPYTKKQKVFLISLKLLGKDQL